jgi:hypothetical protein
VLKGLGVMGEEGVVVMACMLIVEVGWVGGGVGSGCVSALSVCFCFLFVQCPLAFIHFHAASLSSIVAMAIIARCTDSGLGL